MVVKFPSRETTQLRRKLDHSLTVYAIVASATGAGLAALAQSAEAKIIFTPTHQTLIGNGTLSFDVNGDGIADFIILAKHYQTTSSFAVMYALGAQSGDQVPPSLSRFTPAFRRGVTIGSSLFSFSGLGELGFCARRIGDYGAWINAGDRFLGLKFIINGEAHYGWARLKVENVPGTNAATCALRVLLSGYAYETVPNKSIRTGQSCR